MHAVCASEKSALKIQLSVENHHDTLKGRKIIESLNCKAGCHLLTNRTYEDDKARTIVLKQGLIPAHLRREAEKYIGNMIPSFTNATMKLSVFSLVYKTPGCAGGESFSKIIIKAPFDIK